MNNLSDRLKLAIKQSNPKIKQVDLANACKIRASSVSDWMNGRTKNLEGSHLLAAAEILGVNPRWLATGQGKMGAQSKNQICISNSTKEIKIPAFNSCASMGCGEIQEEYETIVREITIELRWLKEQVKNISSTNNLAVITGKGNSMEPTFHDGDALIVDTGTKDFITNGIYVFSVNHNLFVKRLSKQLNGELIATSDNPAIQQLIEKPGEHGYVVHGKVVGIWNWRKAW